jgi:hypothetical protein
VALPPGPRAPAVVNALRFARRPLDVLRAWHARFRPERFVEDGAEPYSWLPFGGGIRRCTGAALAQAEMAEVLRVAVQAVDLRPVRDEPDPVVLRGITLAPRHGVQVEVVGAAAPRVSRARGQRAPDPVR